MTKVSEKRAPTHWSGFQEEADLDRERFVVVAVDDSEFALAAIEAMVEAEGFEFHSALNGQQALVLIEKVKGLHNPSDLGTKILTGERVRALGRGRGEAILNATAQAHLVLLEEALRQRRSGQPTVDAPRLGELRECEHT